MGGLWTHRAMFKLGAKNLFLLCLLIKKKSAVYSADRCNFSEPETDCSRNGNNLYKSWVEGALNSGPFGHFRFANHHFNWQILIKVWTSVIGLSCLIRTILEYKKVRQIWTLFLGSSKGTFGHSKARSCLAHFTDISPLLPIRDLPGVALVITFFTTLFTVHRKI